MAMRASVHDRLFISRGAKTEEYDDVFIFIII